MYRATSAENQVQWGKRGEGESKIEVGQNVLKYILLFEFLKSDEIFEIGKKFIRGYWQASRRTHARTQPFKQCSILFRYDHHCIQNRLRMA